MKPPRFEYTAPSSLDGALAELAEYADEARPLAGGQSLVPLLNFRLGEPGRLVDLGRIAELVGVAIDEEAVTVGAMTPTAGLLTAEVATAAPLLAHAARYVGHPQIRTRGTVGGSIAHADPAAELPAVAVLTGATVELASRRGRRPLPATEFFQGLFATACAPDEIVVSVRFPRSGPGTGWGFREFARRPGDFALAGAAATLALDDEAIASAAVVAFGVAPAPVRAEAAEAALRGRIPTAAAIAEARSAIEGLVEPADTLHGSGAYRRKLTGVLLERALGDALRRAREASGARS